MKNILSKIIFTLIAAIGLILIFSSVKAQTLVDIGTDFIVEFSPENPGPNTTVSAKAISYSFDISRSSVRWILNGKSASAGRTFSFTTGGLGSKTSLTVSIVTPDNKQISKSFYFQSSEVDLLWETATYVPAEYRGKPFPISGSQIKITAYPQGFKTSDSKLVYNWRRNYKNEADQSGIGKKTLIFYNSQFDNGGNEEGAENVEVSVSDISASITAEGRIIIPITEPKILFYEEDPLEGPRYQAELGNNFSLLKPELIIRAEPYFFQKTSLAALSYDWSINYKKIATYQKPNILNLAAPAGAKGYSSVDLMIQNPNILLEFAKKTLQVNLNFQ